MSKLSLWHSSKQREPSGQGDSPRPHQFSALGTSIPGYVTQKEGHDVQSRVCFHGKCCIFCFSLQFLWMLFIQQYRGQRDTGLYFSAMPGDRINICTTAFGICGLSVLSMGWSLQWLCESRVRTRWGPRKTRRPSLPVWTSLSTELHARTELLCLLFPSCYYDCWFHTHTHTYLSLKCSLHRLVFRIEFLSVRYIPVSCLIIRTRT